MSDQTEAPALAVGYQPRIVLESSSDGSFDISRGKVFDDQADAEKAMDKFKAPKGFKVRADLSRIVADMREVAA